MNYRDQACEIDKPCSATNMALNEMESAIAILGEAVDRLAFRTSDIRLAYPDAPKGAGQLTTCADPPASPLVIRLTDLKRAICRKADQLNNLTDEIQL